MRLSTAALFALSLVVVVGCGKEGSEPSDTAPTDDVQPDSSTEVDTGGAAPADDTGGGDDTTTEPPTDVAEDDTDDDTDADANDADDTEETSAPAFDPFVILGAEAHAPIRGQVVRRGTIHLHTGFSHDACDGDVWMKDADPATADGENILTIAGTSHLMVVDEFRNCNSDVRAAICAVAQDFLFFTDHNNNYPSFEYPDVLLHQPENGDELIERDGNPAAMWMTCPDGREVLMSAGVDTHLLAFGMERHAAETIEERKRIYGSKTDEAVDQLREVGALVVSGYSDEWDLDLLYALDFDGFEIYNPATNLRRNIAGTAALVGAMLTDPENAPHPQFALLPIFEENDENMTRWSTLSELRPIFNYLGTNAHQNVFREPLIHGERVDSYRRLMSWFANYVLLPEGEGRYDDRALKASIGAGRHYGVFEYLGFAVGFDFHGERGGEVYEMGARVALDDGPVTLNVVRPSLYGAPEGDFDAPDVTVRVLVARDGGWEVVGEGPDDVSVTVSEPGVYRADVRMVPHHLRPWLGTRADEYIGEVVWVYSNPLFIGVHLEPDPEG